MMTEMSEFDLDAVNNLVLHKQHLRDDSKTDNIVQIVRDVCGLHATSSKAPYLSLFARSQGFAKEHLDDELYVKRSLGKIRCMRGTLHILTKEMIPIAYAATRTLVEKSSKRYAEFRGVSSQKYEEISKSILTILGRREMSASGIKRPLKTPMDVSAVLCLMCDQGLLIRSRPERGWKDKSQKHSVFSEYFPTIDLTKVNEVEAKTFYSHQT